MKLCFFDTMIFCTVGLMLFMVCLSPMMYSYDTPLADSITDKFNEDELTPENKDLLEDMKDQEILNNKLRITAFFMVGTFPIMILMFGISTIMMDYGNVRFIEKGQRSIFCIIGKHIWKNDFHNINRNCVLCDAKQGRYHIETNRIFKNPWKYVED